MSFNSTIAPPPLLLRENIKYHTHLEHIFDLIDRLIDKKKPIKIFEIGCGGAVNLYSIKQKYGEMVDLYGSDIDKTAIEYSQRLSIGEFMQGNAEEKCFDETFDLIIISDVLEHLDSFEKADKTLEMVLSSLTDDGLFYLLCPIERNPLNLYWWFGKLGIFAGHSRKFNGHFIQFRCDQLIGMLGKYFIIEDLRYSCHFFGQLSVAFFFVLKREILSLFGTQVENRFRDSNMVLEKDKFIGYVRKAYLLLTKPLNFLGYYESKLRKRDKFAAMVFHGVMTKKNE